MLGLLQGFSELFPISSLGHSVIAPRLLGWDIHQNDSYFITFLVATHLATALVLLGFFWRDWIRILRETGFEVLALHELQAPPDAVDHPHYDLAPAEWARKWPSEEIWHARKRA